MISFDDCIDYPLENECGPNFSDVCKPDNNGALCKFGLNAKANPQLLVKYGANLERLDLAAAKLEYKALYWLAIMEQFAYRRVATKLLDMRINQGCEDAVNHLQIVVGIHPTGFFGPITLAKANAMTEDDMLTGLAAEAHNHYQQTEEAHPEDKVYDKNWMARAAKLPL
jgi:lysozyme family protein